MQRKKYQHAQIHFSSPERNTNKIKILTVKSTMFLQIEEIDFVRESNAKGKL